MKEYQVEIKETLAMTVTVEAESAAQARELVELQWQCAEHILDSDHHFQDVSFTSPRVRNYER